MSLTKASKHVVAVSELSKALYDDNTADGIKKYVDESLDAFVPVNVSGNAATATLATNATNAVSAQHATTADTATLADTATSADLATTATTAGYATEALHATTADEAALATTATTAISAQNAAALSGLTLAEISAAQLAVVSEVTQSTLDFNFKTVLSASVDHTLGAQPLIKLVLSFDYVRTTPGYWAPGLAFRIIDNAPDGANGVLYYANIATSEEDPSLAFDPDTYGIVPATSPANIFNDGERWTSGDGFVTWNTQGPSGHINLESRWFRPRVDGVNTYTVQVMCRTGSGTPSMIVATRSLMVIKKALP